MDHGENMGRTTLKGSIKKGDKKEIGMKMKGKGRTKMKKCFDNERSSKVREGQAPWTRIGNSSVSPSMPPRRNDTVPF